MQGPRGKGQGAEDAEAIGLAALVHLTEDEDRITRFLMDTGLSPDELRGTAGTHEGLVAVLDHVLADESLLLVFAACAGIDPAAIAPARATLAGDGQPIPRPEQGAPRRSSRRWPGPGAEG